MTVYPKGVDPIPDSPEAIALGCTCGKAVENNDGKGAFSNRKGRCVAWVYVNCPYHGKNLKSYQSRTFIQEYRLEEFKQN